MKRTPLFFLCACAIWVSANGKDIKYPVSAIPAELKVNANVVVRADEGVFKILTRGTATVHYYMAITILNENGRDRAVVALGYDKLRKVSNIKGYTYDANGEQVKKLKSSDIFDRSSYDGFSLFTDNRLKIFDLSHSSYPYTIEYEYEADLANLYIIDDANIGSGEGVSVQHFSYQLIYPQALTPRYKAYNINLTPEKGKVDGMESLLWKIDNVAAQKYEPMSPAGSYVKRISIAPSNFEFNGYIGDMSSWEEIGKWQLLLNEGRDNLPDATKKKIKELTKDLPTVEAKTKALYEYMQSKTRYVSIQLGIGGWQPFDAATVDQNGYGDCKALSNYMVAMLKEVGIKGYYTIIRAGEDEPETDPTFPNREFNHIIVGVPNQADTIWLECTSQTMPFGYIGRFTEGRYGLMVTENGGKLVRTTYYPTEKNVRTTSADVEIDLNGNAKAAVTTKYSGLQYEQDGLEFVLNYSGEEQKKWIQKVTDIPSFDVTKFSLTAEKARIPSAVLKVDLSLNKYASVSNKRIFLTPNLLNKSKFIPEKIDGRKSEFELGNGYTKVDTIRFHLPESIYPEYLPPNTKITSKFGSYESGYKLDQGSLIYFRKMVRKDGKYPAEAYNELVDFYRNVNKADNTKLVFLSKT